MNAPRLLSLVLLLSVTSCSGSSDSGDTTPGEDSSSAQQDGNADDTSSAPVDSGTNPVDSALADSATSADTGSSAIDSAITDGTIVDSATVDSMIVDSMIVDSTSVDSAKDGASDTGKPDTEDSGADTAVTDSGSETGTVTHLKYVWIIVEENHNWSSIKGSTQAPYINDTLLKAGAHAEKYSDRGLHPSEPNYIWMEAGDNLGITDDSDPSSNSVTTTNHLSTKLEFAGITWKSWQEDIDETECPLTSISNYAPKHDPFVFFEDVTDGNDPMSAHCIAHHANTKTFQTALAAGNVPSFNFVTPNQCNDMHGTGVCATNLIKRGDDWLKTIVPQIQATTQYKEAGVIFIVWDEGTGGTSNIGLIALSPFAKVGFSDDTNVYSHSSLLRTVQTIFGVTPFIRDAAAAKDLSNLFTAFP